MIARVGSGWQTVLADLSLILFMVTASALSQADNAQQKLQSPAPDTWSPPPHGEPVAVWREDAGAPPIGQWLAGLDADPRLQLTITAFYRPGGQASALAQADALSRQAGTHAGNARIAIEPGDSPAIASLAYDVPQATVARGLQDKGTAQSNDRSR